METATLNHLVEEFYQPLFKFAMRLSKNPADAADYTQQTFFLAQTKGDQIRNPSKVKSWLFTTLYREFLKRRRHETKFPKFELESSEPDLPRVTPNHVNRMDAKDAMSRVSSLNERYRVPLLMFYKEQKSYKEIAAELGVPIGTVMSRLARAKTELRGLLQD